MSHSYSLSQLGWIPFFQQQLSLEELDDHLVGRVVAQHRSNIELLTEQGKLFLPFISSMPDLTVGDWVLLNTQHQFQRLLERFSLFSRKSPGTKLGTQLIAANIDTVFVVSSLNTNFNLNRIERYLAVANAATVEPVVVLTKSDLCDEPANYLQQVQAIDSMLMVEAVNGLDENSVKVLEPWCNSGKTIAFLGSSGVGKSTLVNTLLGLETQSTGSIRQEDGRGRHTTTARSIHIMPSGGLLLDTPGMRELQISDCEQGLEDTFSEISKLASACKFKDCRHQSEPGCAVLAAIESGELEKRRLENYQKLMREQAVNSASLAEKHARGRKLSLYQHSVQTHARKRKQG